MSKKFDDKRYNGDLWGKQDPWEDNESVTEYRGKTQSYTAKCAHSHPALKFKVDGKGVKIDGDPAMAVDAFCNNSVTPHSRSKKTWQAQANNSGI